MLKLMSKLNQQEQGFTLVEVLVGILIATTFTLIAMQAIVIAAYFKVRAQKTAEGTIWIQEDLEEVRYAAYQLSSNSTLCDASTKASGYADSLRDNISRNGADAANDTEVDFAKTKISVGGSHALARTFDVYSVAPYNVLQINYKVRDTTDPDYPNNEPIAELYTEVIPDAAFQCD